MKFIHTADWHIGRTLAQYSLIDDQRCFLDAFVRFAVQEQVDAVFIAGDIYNRAVPSTQAVQLLDETFSRIVLEHHIPVLAVSGNHDSPERLSFGSRMLRDAGLYIVGTLEEQMKTVTFGEGKERVTCHLLPYFTPAQVREVYGDDDIVTTNDAFAAILRHNRPLIETPGMHMLLAHGFFARLGDHQREDPVFSASELSVGALDIIDISEAASLFDYIALGHLHAPQRLGSDVVRYAGSPLKYSLSEARQSKSVVTVETECGKIKSVQTKSFEVLHDVRIIEGPFDELINPQNQQESSLQDYVYANIVGDDAILYAMQKLRMVFPNILGLSFTQQMQIPDTAYSIEGVRMSTMDELFEQFYEYVSGAPMEEERREIVRQVVHEIQEEKS